ncbi:MAG: STAS domain-containing protein [Candidatus Methylacidiphilales bacterium]|nr:STAS domain-containing protein [Candidatus Methylacidiphilales bacterium]
MDNSKILVAREEGQGFIHVVGRGSFQNANAVKTFYLQMLTRGVHQWTVDLEECTYLDSTFLGTLAGLGMKLREHQGKVKIVKVTPRNMELFQNLGLDRILSINAPAPAEPKKMDELEAGSPTKRESGLNMLEAHTNLINLDPRNTPKFKDVVAYLKEDLGIPGDE